MEDGLTQMADFVRADTNFRVIGNGEEAKHFDIWLRTTRVSKGLPDLRLQVSTYRSAAVLEEYSI